MHFVELGSKLNTFENLQNHCICSAVVKVAKTVFVNNVLTPTGLGKTKTHFSNRRDFNSHPVITEFASAYVMPCPSSPRVPGQRECACRTVSFVIAVVVM